jgi:hypothetical protein
MHNDTYMRLLWEHDEAYREQLAGMREWLDGDYAFGTGIVTVSFESLGVSVLGLIPLTPQQHFPGQNTSKGIARYDLWGMR